MNFNSSIINITTLCLIIILIIFITFKISNFKCTIKTFQPGSVNLSDEQIVSNDAITLKDTITEFDILLPERTFESQLLSFILFSFIIYNKMFNLIYIIIKIFLFLFYLFIFIYIIIIIICPTHLYMHFK